MSTATIETSRNLGPQAVDSANLGLRRARELGQSIRQVCRSEASLELFGGKLVHLLASQTNIVAATLFDQSDAAEWRVTAPLECMPELVPTARAWEERLIRGIQTASLSSGVSFLQLPGDLAEEAYVGVLAPFACDDTAIGVVCLVGNARSRPELLLTAQLVAAEAAAALGQQSQSSAARDSDTDELLTTALTAASDGDYARGYDDLANQLRDELQCDSILIGVRSGLAQNCRLQAISGVNQFQRHSPIATCAEELLNEAVLRDATQYYDETHPAPTATDAQKQLAKLCQMRHVVSGPVRNRNGKTIGAWVIMQEERRDVFKEARWAMLFRETADDIASRLTPCLELLQRYRPHPLQRMVQGVFGASTRRRRRVCWLIAAGLVCLAALPLPYRVKCDGEVQATTRRHIPVPYIGVLHEVLVEPGDVVQTGQVLARMDGREIAWELASRQAEYSRAKKQHDVQLASQHTAAAQVARLDMERLNLQIKLLENRAANLDIRSPINGVVIRGDPKKKENARLKMGETLFEIGPLKEMVVDVFVPDEDVAHVQPKQQVQIRLDAFPGSPRQGTIRRVSPQAEPRGQESVFVAEVELDNGDGTLRPGMMGRCRIRTATRPLVWNMFHGAWDRIIYLFLW